VNDLNERTGDARIRVISSGVGAIVKSDVDFLASATKGVIFGFNVGCADTSVKNFAKHKNIDVLSESIVYRLEDEMVSLYIYICVCLCVYVCVCVCVCVCVFACLYDRLYGYSIF
jgi:hypothetical protein